MSQENQPISNAAPIDAPAFKRDPADGAIDINDLPPIPWTRSVLGAPLFRGLAMVAGVGDLQDHQRDPSLDPRSFGLSRAKRLIRLYNAEGPVAQAYFDEGVRLQAAIDATLPPVQGSPRKPGAPPLTPAKTTFRESGPKPNRWS